MGYRFRKSINLGRGFKINLSKTGIGYSWGIPGIRISKSANGRNRLTCSIPGTGISYVKDISFGQKQQKQKCKNQSQTETAEEKIGNTEFVENSDYDEFINEINGFRKKDIAIKIIIILLSLVLSFVLMNPIVIAAGIIVFGVYMLYRNTAMKISVEYDFDDENKKINETTNAFFNTIASSENLWLIESRYKNSDSISNIEADNYIERLPVSITKKVPYYLKTNIKCHCLSIQDKEFYFLPNKILVHTKNKTYGLNFQELSFKFNEIAFTERQGVPSDSEVVGYTYQYVNKKGDPDKRYKHNPQFPKCSYGIIEIKNDDGLNLSLLLSSKSKTMQAKQYYESLRNTNIDTTKKCTTCGKEITADAIFCKHCGAKQ